MVIKASASAEIRTLLAHLQSAEAVVREGAVARLAVIGARAVDRLIALYTATSDVTTRLAILHTLEAIGDTRAEPVAKRALQDGREIGVAAAAVLRRLLTSSDDRAAAGALDALVGAALDPQADRLTRLAAFEALQDASDQVRQRLAQALREDADDVLRGRAGGAVPTPTVAEQVVWEEALQGRLPDTAGTLHRLVSAHAASAPLTRLRQLIEAVHLRETRGAEMRAWTAVRGSLHQALALRGSRIALYDLRETLERSAGPLPASFLSALQSLGDADCLEALAAAWSHAGPGGEEWRNQISVAFRAVARRVRGVRRDAVVRRIASRWPDAVALVADGISTPSRTTPRPTKADRSARSSP